VLYVGVLEEVDGEGLQNSMTSLCDFVVLPITNATKNVAKKSRHESSL
jgi:hypothetical protein